jgi:hypothetical protein
MNSWARAEAFDREPVRIGVEPHRLKYWLERGEVCFDLLQNTYPNAFLSLRGQFDVVVDPHYLKC